MTMKYLVIRFSSLGDCILLGPLLSALKAGGAEEVAVVTKEQYRQLFSAVPGVDEIYALPKKAGTRDVIKLASSIKTKSGPPNPTGWVKIQSPKYPFLRSDTTTDEAVEQPGFQE